MSFKFNIDETVEKEIFYGSYCIYILGGHHIERPPDFYVQIIDVKTNEEIQLTEKKFKSRGFKFGRKAILFYTFEIEAYGKFKISAHNFEDMFINDSILEGIPFPFSIPHKILSIIFNRKSDRIPLKTIELAIE